MPIRVLCLHGSRQTDFLFEQRLKDLRLKGSRIDIEFVFAIAPHELSNRTRCWWRHPGLGDALLPDDDGSSPDITPNVIVEDWAASVDELTKFAAEEGPFDGILGFSQGAAAAAILSFAFRLQTGSPAPLKSAYPPKFVILAGGYLPEPLEKLVTACGVAVASLPTPPAPASLPIPSLHIFSQRDTAVPAEQSLRLSTLYARPQVLEHDLGHAVPQRSAHVTAILDFIAKHGAPPPAPAEPEPADGARIATGPDAAAGGALPAEQAEELEALEAIFADELEVSRRVVPALLAVNLGGAAARGAASTGDDNDGDARPSSRYRIVYRLPGDYPASAPPSVTVEGPLAASDPMWTRIRAHVASAVEEMAGCAAVYAVTESVREWLDTNLQGYKGVGGRGGLTSQGMAGTTPGLSAAERLLPNLGKSGDPYRFSEDHWALKEESDPELIRQATRRAAEMYQRGEIGPLPCVSSSNMGSRWNLTVGLVGKPSAGKSTLFNATLNPATDEEGAKVGAYPFTTILPNIGRGFFAAPCPCVPMGVEDACCAGFGHVAFRPLRPNPEYTSLRGHTQHAASSASILTSEDVHEGLKWRRVPLLMKDVAGLVPGAYAGRGKGNAFLNDLVEADVLIHVVDVSGTTDSGGNLITDLASSEAATISDPVHEVTWVREELHRWIFDNLKAKWAALVRRPEKLGAMFTGYHATPNVIEKTLQSVGLSPSSMDAIRGWGELDLHQCVANFLRIRFPIVLALNKADLPESPDRIKRILSELPWETAVATSAQTETFLCRMRREGKIVYTDGADSIRLHEGVKESDLRPEVVERLRAARAILQRYGSTGVLAAVTAAASLRTPALAFPVVDVRSCVSLRPLNFVKAGKLSTESEALEEGLGGLAISTLDAHSSAVLRDAVVLHPGSLIENLFSVLKKPPVVYLEGDFVRAEGVGVDVKVGGRQVPMDVDSYQPRPWKKDEPLCFSVVRIMTNRKAQWQK